MKKSHLLLIAVSTPLAFSLIVLWLLIPSTIIFCLTNSNTMVHMAWPRTGLEATPPTGCNSFSLTVLAPPHKLSAVVNLVPRTKGPGNEVVLWCPPGIDFGPLVFLAL